MSRFVILFSALYFFISTKTFCQAPPNDECSTAILLPVNNDNSCTNLYSGTTYYSTQSLPSCVNTGYPAKDVWFKFVATATTHRITVTQTSADRYVYQV